MSGDRSISELMHPHTSFAGLIYLFFEFLIGENRLLIMSAWGVTVFVLFFLAGCGSLPRDPAKPQSEAEMFPVNCGKPAVNVAPETGPLGIVVNTGTAPSQLCWFDQNKRLIEQWYLEGADRHLLSQTGMPFPQQFVRHIDPGCYTVEIFPFYKDMVTLWPVRIATIMLPKQTQQVCTSNSDITYLVNGRYYNWQLQIGGPNIPSGARIYTPTNIVPGLIQFRSPF